MLRHAILPLLAGILTIAPPAAFADEKKPAELLIQDSFEVGTSAPAGWKQGPAVPGVKYIYDRKQASDGKRSLSLQKSERRYFPIASWFRMVPHQGGKPFLKLRAKAKTSNVTKAILDVQFYGDNQALLGHEWAAYIGQKSPDDPLANHDWKVYEGTVPIPAETKQIGIALQIYGPGKIWFDELEAQYVSEKPVDPKHDQKTSAARDEPLDDLVIPPVSDVETPSGALATYMYLPPDSRRHKLENGYPLLLVLPGGNGSADFHAFIARIHKQALDGRFAVAQLLAPPHIVWPTRSTVARIGTTEESIAAVIEALAAEHDIDREHVYALAWSSSGPAAYAAILQERSPLAGAFIAMSVFKPEQLPPLTNAAGRRIYLLHSPNDLVCPYRMAKQAHQELAASGADVTLVDYSGGHGWHGAVYDNIRDGIHWLQQR